MIKVEADVNTVGNEFYSPMLRALEKTALLQKRYTLEAKYLRNF